MAYQVYFGDLTEEIQALLLTVLKLKEETETLEPGEAEMLYALRGSTTPAPVPPDEQPSRAQRQPGAGGGGRRGPSRRGSRSRGSGGGGSSGGGGGGSNN